MNFLLARSVIEKLMPISENTMYSVIGKGNMQEWKKFCMFDFE